MRKNNKKQKKSLIFSTAVVITGCIATAVYVNQTMNTATDYKVDLSQLNVSENPGTGIVNDPEFNSGASLARVSGQDVVNTIPEENSKTSDKVSDQEAAKAQKQEVTEDDKKQEENADEFSDDADESRQTSSVSVVSPVADLAFSPEDGMGWPAMGNVILNYSMDSAVYFATLEQYKYNPAILIGAQQGTSVSACARGQVVSVSQSSELGQYVVMNIGNGYEVTYGQLEDLQVQEGSVVSRGQVIGNVAKTSKYYSVEGDHVYLKITKDGEPVDPLTLMQ